MDTRYAKEYAMFYKTTGVSFQEAYRAIFGRDMSYERKVLNLRSFFNRGYK